MSKKELPKKVTPTKVTNKNQPAPELKPLGFKVLKEEDLQVQVQIDGATIVFERQLDGKITIRRLLSN